MLHTDVDECGISIYMVTNDQGLCLIRTKDYAIANFVAKHAIGIPPNLRLTVGGDPGTWTRNPPIWSHIRKINR